MLEAMNYGTNMIHGAVMDFQAVHPAMYDVVGHITRACGIAAICLSLVAIFVIPMIKNRKHTK